MTHLLLVAIFIAVILGFIFAKLDAFKFHKNIVIYKDDKRARSWIIAVLLCVISVLVFTYAKYGNVSSYSELFRAVYRAVANYHLGIASMTIMLHFGVYWTTFDLFMNLFSKRPWDYTSYGTGDPNRTLSDRVFHIFGEYAGKIQVAFKIVVFSIALYWTTLFL